MTGQGPLAGVVVVDLSRALAGPHATMMMGDLGARVIKVERPGLGDDTRGWGPPFVDPEDGQRESTYFLSANRNKESICLDFKDEADTHLLLDLIARADVLVDNFRPGVMERLGFDQQTLDACNPRLVRLSISGFGHDGPEAHRTGYDQIAQGEGGLMSITGSGPDDPQKFGTPICDLVAGMYGAYGVLAALRERDRTGRGQVVRTSLLAAAVGMHGFQSSRWTIGGVVGRGVGNHHPSVTPYGLFRCADGAVQIAVGSESLWHDFCEGFDLDPDRPGMATNPDRVGNRDEVIELVEEVFSVWKSADLVDRLAEVGIPCGRVRTIDEVYDWEQTRSQGLVLDVEHSTLGEIRLPGTPLRFFGGDEERTWRGHRPPPALDEHGSAIREWVAGQAS